MAFPGKTTRFSASTEEAHMSLPGDVLIASPLLEATQAITINAPPEQVWPWIMQIGQGRAGFYSDSRWWDAAVDLYYRVLSREQGHSSLGYHVIDDEHIVPAWQTLHAGDAILDGPPGTAFYAVWHIEPNRSLVLFTHTHLPYLLPARLRDNKHFRISGELSGDYLLLRLDHGRTRLIHRMRAVCKPWPFRVVVVPVVIVWGEMITTRNYLRGLKRRAERSLSQ